MLTLMKPKVKPRILGLILGRNVAGPESPSSDSPPPTPAGWGGGAFSRTTQHSRATGLCMYKVLCSIRPWVITTHQKLPVPSKHPWVITTHQKLPVPSKHPWVITTHQKLPVPSKRPWVITTHQKLPVPSKHPWVITTHQRLPVPSKRPWVITTHQKLPVQSKRPPPLF